MTRFPQGISAFSTFAVGEEKPKRENERARSSASDALPEWSCKPKVGGAAKAACKSRSRPEVYKHASFMRNQLLVRLGVQPKWYPLRACPLGVFEIGAILGSISGSCWLFCFRSKQAKRVRGFSHPRSFLLHAWSPPEMRSQTCGRGRGQNCETGQSHGQNLWTL